MPKKKKTEDTPVIENIRMMPERGYQQIGQTEILLQEACAVHQRKEHDKEEQT